MNLSYGCARWLCADYAFRASNQSSHKLQGTNISCARTNGMSDGADSPMRLMTMPRHDEVVEGIVNEGIELYVVDGTLSHPRRRASPESLWQQMQSRLRKRMSYACLRLRIHSRAMETAVTELIAEAITGSKIDERVALTTRSLLATGMSGMLNNIEMLCRLG